MMPSSGSSSLGRASGAGTGAGAGGFVSGAKETDFRRCSRSVLGGDTELVASVSDETTEWSPWGSNGTEEGGETNVGKGDGN